MASTCHSAQVQVCVQHTAVACTTDFRGMPPALRLSCAVIVFAWDDPGYWAVLSLGCNNKTDLRKANSIELDRMRSQGVQVRIDSVDGACVCPFQPQSNLGLVSRDFKVWG